MYDNDNEEWLGDCDIEFATSTCFPPHEEVCVLWNCERPAAGSWIEMCEPHETYTIYPVCAVHHDFAADALASIHEVFEFAGLLTEGSE